MCTVYVTASVYFNKFLRYLLTFPRCMTCLNELPQIISPPHKLRLIPGNLRNWFHLSWLYHHHNRWQNSAFWAITFLRKFCHIWSPFHFLEFRNSSSFTELSLQPCVQQPTWRTAGHIEHLKSRDCNRCAMWTGVRENRECFLQLSWM
jgi:hypothetical protein